MPFMHTIYKTFNSMSEAQSYLNDNFKGHGTIYDMDTQEIIQQCRCSSAMRNPKEIVGVYTNEDRPITKLNLVKIFESILLEGIPLPEVYEKFYTAKVDTLDNFVKLNSLDPTADVDSKGKYLDFILKIYKKDYNKDIDAMSKDFKEIIANLELFKNKVKARDINLIKTYADFKELLTPYITNPNLGKSRQEIKKDDADTIYDKNGWKIIIPKTEAAAKLYGKNTKWCTSAEVDNQFKTYNAWGKLYIIINTNKTSDNKWQFQFATRVYKNDLDEEMDKGYFDDISIDVINFLLSIKLDDTMSQVNFVARLLLKDYKGIDNIHNISSYYLRILLDPTIDKSVYEIDDVPNYKYRFEAIAKRNKSGYADVLNDYSATGRITPLMRVLYEGYYSLVKIALTNGADKSINHVSLDNQTALYIVISRALTRDSSNNAANMKMIKYLLANGAKKSINIIGPQERTCLSNACVLGDKEIVDLLLANGAKTDLNSKTKEAYNRYIKDNPGT